MSGPLLFFVSLIYWVVAIDQARKGSWAGFLTWSAYGVANWGLMLTAK